VAVDALLGAVGLAGASGPPLRIAHIALANLRGDAETVSTILAADWFANTGSLAGTWSVAGEAAALVGSHTAAVDAGLRAYRDAVEREQSLGIRNISGVQCIEKLSIMTK